MLSRYKMDVAPLYGSELERHLFATASSRRRALRRAQRESMREWLRKRWEERAARWKSHEQQDR